jgi:archaellum component FlaC
MGKNIRWFIIPAFFLYFVVPVSGGLSAQETFEKQKGAEFEKIPEDFSRGGAEILVENKNAVLEWKKTGPIGERKELYGPPSFVTEYGVEITFEYGVQEGGIYFIVASIKEWGVDIVFQSSNEILSKDDLQEQLSDFFTKEGSDSPLWRVSDGQKETFHPGQDETDPQSLDKDRIREFILKISDDKVLEELEWKIDGLKKQASREKELWDKVNERYQKFESDFDISPVLSDFSGSDDPEKRDEILENFLQRVEDGEYDISFEDRKAMLEGYVSFREDLIYLRGQYMFLLQESKTIIRKIEELLNLSNSNIYLKYDPERIKVLIKIEPKNDVVPDPLNERS